MSTDRAVARDRPELARDRHLMDIDPVMRGFNGAARVKTVLDVGVSEHDMRAALATGVVARPHRGVLALPGAEPRAILAARLGAPLTCLSALEFWGLPVLKPTPEAHLAVRRSFALRGREANGARLHYYRATPRETAVVHVAEALDCAGSCLDETWHLVAVDAALHRGLISLRDVMAFTRTGRDRRDFLLGYADPRSEAPGETIARLRLAQAGFAVRPQAYVDGAGRVDIEVDRLLILQVDGYGPHSGKSAFTRDREKSRAVVKAGRPQLSYAASELLGYYAADVVGDVREALSLWNSKDPSQIRPSGPQILRLSRDAFRTGPSSA